MRRLSVAIGAVAIALGAIAGGGAQPPARAAGLSVMPSVEVLPNALPGRRSVPATLKLSQRIGLDDGAHPPALASMVLDLDKNVVVDTSGVPACTLGYDIGHPPDWYEKRCRSARIGVGAASVEVLFPDQMAVTRTSQVNVYSGGRRSGASVFFVAMYFDAPISGRIVASARVKPGAPGKRLRQRVEISVPKIANGAGSITKLDFTLDRRVVSARCSDRRLEFRTSARFYEDAGQAGSAIGATCERRERTKRQSTHRRRDL